MLDSKRRADRRARSACARARRRRRFGCRSIRCRRWSRWSGWTSRSSIPARRRFALGVGWLVVGVDRLPLLRRARSAGGRLPRPLFAIVVCVVAGSQRARRAAAAAAVGERGMRRASCTDRGYPVFTVDGKPFFVFGAAFFYERIPRDRWLDVAARVQARSASTRSISTCIWNWHQPSPTRPPRLHRRDRSAPRSARRAGAAHALGFKIILRPGPVIRNEWRNGGYPAWLLERPEYDMPLHDVLEGRYPATATLQNAHADARRRGMAAQRDAPARVAALAARASCAPSRRTSHDVIAIALDDDQGAYLDNDTWPAPHWHAYVDWLRLTRAERRRARAFRSSSTRTR